MSVSEQRDKKIKEKSKEKQKEDTNQDILWDKVRNVVCILVLLLPGMTSLYISLKWYCELGERL